MMFGKMKLQTVSADSQVQRQICFETVLEFDFIWSYVDMNSVTRRVVVEEGQQTNVFLTND